MALIRSVVVQMILPSDRGFANAASANQRDQSHVLRKVLRERIEVWLATNRFSSVLHRCRRCQTLLFNTNYKTILRVALLAGCCVQL